MHAHDYKTWEGFEDQNVLVLGIGDSATDIAVETSRVSKMTFLAMRRGAYVIPKFMKGKPTDSSARAHQPAAACRTAGRLQAPARHDPGRDGGLRPAEARPQAARAHPTVSADLLPRIGHGRITPKPNIHRLEGENVRFTDGTTEPIDTIVYCTGYKITFPFLSDELVPVRDNRVALYRRVVPPDAVASTSSG